MVNKKGLSVLFLCLTVMFGLGVSVASAVSTAVEFTTTCVPVADIIEPDSDILYFTHQDGNTDKVDCVDGWAAVGYDDVQVHGVASDEGAGDSKIVDIKYKRGALNWNIANWEKPEDITEDWWSLVQDPALKEGETRYCVKATDDEGNEERLNESDDCCIVCVDLSEPEAPSRPQTFGDECEEGYFNKETVRFSWEGADTGCAEGDYNEVYIEVDDGEQISNVNSTSPKYSDDYYDLAGEDGKAYRIKVRIIDNAGNTGEWSEFSDWIHIDLTSPTVKIKKPGYIWLNDDFELVEEDIDENLWKCYYQIENNESGVFAVTKESEEVECNTPVMIDVSEYCPVEGSNKCRVYKVVKDKACNDDSSYRTFDVDTHDPVTKKYIDGEEFDAEKHEFVKATSVFTLNCEDTASGCKETWYRITYEDEKELSTEEDDWIKGNTFMLDKGDGVYTVEYYSVDKAKNEEEVTKQEHTVDSVAPVTTKYVDGHVATEEDYFFTEQATFTFECVDDLSDCETFFVLTYPDNTTEEFLYSETGPFILNGDHGDGAYHIKFWSVDEAGNEEIPQEQDHVRDILPPVTTKSVELYSYGENFRFVRSDTGFILECDDNGGSGCNETYFMITRPDESSSGLQTYTEGFSLGNESGTYKLMFWSVDKIGHAETPIEQEHVVDNDAPVTTKTIDNTYYDEVNDINWVSTRSLFMLDCEDEEGVGCAETRYRINEGDWVVASNFSLTGESGEYFIEYQSEDYLLNVEDIKNQTDKLDSRAPLLSVLNPFDEENITLCHQAIVVEASDGESGIKDIKAELIDSNGSVVKTSNLVRTATGTWEAYMDKKIKAGRYVLRVTAKDNVGNEVVKEIVENVLPTVYVTGFENPQCEVDSKNGGNCSFKVNVCIRGANSIKLMMEKIEGVVTPSSMNARISKDGKIALVGLTEAQSQLLTLGDEEINDVVQFNWSMSMPNGIGELVGIGSHKIKYHIRSFIEEIEE